MKSVLEICCGSFEDVKTAYENGADRVELNSALYIGGLNSVRFLLWRWYVREVVDSVILRRNIRQ